MYNERGCDNEGTVCMLLCISYSDILLIYYMAGESLRVIREYNNSKDYGDGVED